MNDSIEKRIELKAPISRVWRALTDYREFGEWFRVKLEGPFIPGQVSRGQMTYPGCEHVKWEAVVQKMEPERPHSLNLGWKRLPVARCWCSPSPASINFPMTAVSRHSEETRAAGRNK